MAGPPFLTVSVYARFVPWLTGSGAAVFTMLTSACVGPATMVETVAELFPGLGSPIVLETLGVSMIVVPEGVAAFTATTNGKLNVPFRGMVCPVFSVHVNVPVPPTGMVGVHVQDAAVAEEA